ncbi:DUF2156 domain-containing protein [Propionispira raffinosivorans]|uniref:DUF2156 domain-containing protein n=1 Tax=Propionispira raffinosivorans TaxID=86959 RepID=UPI0003708717|nr:phosphatidylglycerol lysyltransferase domain-containing protein [Propionispira raffinosivorans]
MIKINFQALEKEDKQAVDAFFKDRYYENSHFNFTNLFMWRSAYNIMWTIQDDVLYMKAEWDGKEFALQPFGPADKMQLAIKNWLDYFARTGGDFSMYGIEKKMADEFIAYDEAAFNIEADRDNFDYVYSSEDLITLAGRKYHSKKNHLNSFRKTYPNAEYMPITEDIMLECKLNINSWYKKHSQENPDDPFIAAERNAIIEVLNNFVEFGLKGGAIMLDKRVVAFTFGEQLNEDTAVIHVEKADPEIRGAYPAINQSFIQNAWADMKYINREEDMGLEGLRKAKESYKPVKLIEKFNVQLK